MNERHKGQLKLAHHLYDNRDLKKELIYQREFLDTGYLSYQQVCFNKWIFDECLKRLEERKVGKWNILACDLYMCSKCYAKFTHKFNYCPTCGAEMKGEENGN